MGNKIILIILSVFFISSVSAVQVCQVYDDFSSGSLNTLKWEESTNAGFIDEHFVDANETYHIAQYFIRNSDTRLIPIREFYPNEEFKYTLTYNSGSGNHLSTIWPSGDDANGIIESCTTPSPGCGGVGYLNGETAAGTQKGDYLIAYQFFNNYIILNFTRPDNTNVWFKMSNVNPPYTFGIMNIAGHNGRMHIDLDNFVICTEIPEPTLIERIEFLESWKEIIENWKISIINSLAILNSEFSNLKEIVDNHEERITILENFSMTENLTPDYWKYLSSNERKNIVCGYAEDNHLESIEDLGWSCKLIYKNINKKEIVNCKCKIKK